MKKNAGKKVQVTGGGSGTGIAALINGTTDIANASRDVRISRSIVSSSTSDRPPEPGSGRSAAGSSCRRTSVTSRDLSSIAHREKPRSCRTWWAVRPTCR